MTIAPPSATAPIVESTPAPAAPGAPSAPISQPSKPTASTAPEKSAMDEAFGDLDKVVTTPKPAPQKPTPKKPPEEAQVEPEQVSEEQKTVDEKTGNKSSVSELRKVYENTKKELYAAREEIKKFKEAKPAEPPELATYKERLEAAEKRQEEYEQKLRETAYERSKDYLEKYQKPFEEAYHYAVRAVVGDQGAGIKGLKVAMEDGSVRQAESTDFDRVLMTVDDGDALDLAEQLFGNKAKIAWDYRLKVRDADAARFRAIEGAKRDGGEREFKAKETETRQNQQMGQMWKEINGQAAERFPKYFQPEEGDDVGNDLLTKGYELADSAFSNSNGRSPEDQVRLHASIRNRAAAFTREVYRTTKLEKRVSELEAELKQYQSSEPGPGDGHGGNNGDGDSFGADLLQADA